MTLPRVHGWYTFEVLYREAVVNAPENAHFVEVGSWLGKSAIGMCNLFNEYKRTDIRFDCIDAWEEGDWMSGGVDIKAQFDAHGDLHAVFKANIKAYGHAHLIYDSFKCDSTLGASMYEDESLDFVFLDADHRYPKVRDDILTWLPKINEGGVLAGDDYDWAGVKESVDEVLGPEACIHQRLWKTIKQS